MTGLQLLGIGILSTIFGGLFVMTSIVTGWKVSLGVWFTAICLAAVITVGVALLTETPLTLMEFLSL